MLVRERLKSCLALPVMTGILHEWDVELYGRLLETGGGKERMTKFFQVQLNTGTASGRYGMLRVAA